MTAADKPPTPINEPRVVEGFVFVPLAIAIDMCEYVLLELIYVVLV